MEEEGGRQEAQVTQGAGTGNRTLSCCTGRSRSRACSWVLFEGNVHIRHDILNEDISERHQTYIVVSSEYEIIFTLLPTHLCPASHLDTQVRDLSTSVHRRYLLPKPQHVDPVDGRTTFKASSQDSPQVTATSAYPTAPAESALQPNRECGRGSPW